ncbi:MAG: hypothetical protein IJZ04_09930 [Clostridia bacterium]|nr:hypothetical protein [Clostridia bacterium]MBQ8739794.1 hypothetical protein [Clostridia bacterium]
MFDKIIDKIRECSGLSVHDRLYDLERGEVVAKIMPKEYDSGVCASVLHLTCSGLTYAEALICFDKICTGLDALPSEDNDILEISLEGTVIKYDSVSGMVRVLGSFAVYTEVISNED